MAAEYNGSDALQRRYVFDPTTGQPVIWYEGTGTTSPRYLSADERGSVISVSDSTGASLAINKYDEYGIPAFGSLANQRFGYTGQAWLPEMGVQYSRARMYSPPLGRFMQPDPIGYAGDGPNLYAYVLNDPVNFVDPSGTEAAWMINCYGHCSGDAGGGSQYWNSSQLGYWEYHPVEYAWDPGTQSWSPIITAPTWVPYANFGSDFGVNWGAIWNDVSLGIRDLADAAKSLVCKAPSVNVGAAADAYAGAGGTVAGGASFNPRNGQLSGGFDVGVGVGAGGGGRIVSGSAGGIGSASSSTAPVVTAGLNLNGTAVSPFGGATGSYQLLGSNPRDWSLGATGGADLSANVNVSGHAQFNGPALYHCD